MALFTYKGLDAAGREVKGPLTAENLQQAKQRLKGMGVMLTDIREQKAEDSTKRASNFSFGSPISIGDLSLMTRQLATLIRARIQIVEALSALIDQTDNPKMRIVLSEIRQKVNEGGALARALGDYPTIFDNVYVNMVEAGEASGTLDVVLLRLAEFTESQRALKNKVKSAMTYPLVMISMGFIMISIIFIVVIPKITKIFVTMKRELPIQTRVCIAISNFLMNYWWLVIIALVFGTAFFRKWVRTPKGQAHWHRLVLRLPITGEIITMVNVGRFCSTLATLLNSGVPILAAMRIVKNLVSNVHMAAAVEDAKDSISEGASMSGPLIRSGLFPAMVTHMIKLGERSGELEPMLQIVAENYEEQVNAKLSGLTSVLEPIMMIAMGLAVAIIVFSVIGPMLELNTIR